MDNYTIIAGLDCGKQHVDACVLGQELPLDLKQFAQTYETERYTSSKQDLAKLVTIAEAFFIEPTGVYYQIFATHIKEAGKPIFLISSKRARHYAMYHGMISKTDRLDPAAIVAFSREMLNKAQKSALEDLKQSRDFIRLELSQMREVLYQMKSLGKQNTAAQCRLDQRLCLEWPEIVKVHEQSDRDWCKPNPPALWRYIAGEEVYNQKKRDRQLKTTSGLGLSDQSRNLAKRLLKLEEDEYWLELELAKLLNEPFLKPYNKALDQIKCPPKIRARFLTVMYPFDRFLEKGHERIQHVNGTHLCKRKSGKTKRNKSLDSFKLYMGLGLVINQSGQGKDWIPGGSADIRAKWYQLVDIQVVKARQRKHTKDKLESLKEEHKESTPYDHTNKRWMPWNNPLIVEAIARDHKTTRLLAAARIHYEELKDTHRVDAHRRMLVSSRLCKGLYKELVKQFVQP